MSAPNSSFVRACRRQSVDHTPVWFMRQAGRYMPEYRAIRKQHSLLEICKNPNLAAHVTIEAADALIDTLDKELNEGGQGNPDSVGAVPQAARPT